jgi:D-alanyl-D-alanine carboxypeptidase
VGSHRAVPSPHGTASRRTLREAERTTEHRTSPAARWSVRIGVLVALAGITVFLPLTDRVAAGNPTAVATTDVARGLPGTVEALTADKGAGLPPASLVSAEVSAARSLVAASRSDDRDPLPGCDGSTRPAGANGLLKTSDLCTLWVGKLQLRADAAVSLAEMNQAFVARFGADMCITDAYRTLAEQRHLAATKGGLAAVPGRSNHGWGLAIDLCRPEQTGKKWAWIKENGAVFGWENPKWALSGGSGPHEPWHWEYTRGVKADGEYYND